MSLQYRILGVFIALSLHASNLSCLMAQTNKTLKVGVDANYSLEMAAAGANWRWQNEDSSLFDGMARRGVSEFRVRVWTKEDGPHGKKYAAELIKQTRRAGLNPYAVIFLSEDWADLMKQPVPAAWKDLSFDDRVKAVANYSFETVEYLRKEGLENHLYEIGNEIDYGICGEYPGKSTKKNPESLSRRCWPQAAKLIKASQAGVRRADPEAMFMVHISHWWDTNFCTAFFEFMKKEGVEIDYAGLSYFPSSNIGGSLEFDEFGATATAVSKAIGCPIIVAETAYPCTRDFKGQFSRWKYEVMGFPISLEGQRRWIQAFLAYCQQHSDIHSVYYWSPEWFGEGMWKGFALFDPKGNSRPAWDAFDSQSWNSVKSKKTRYFELRGDRLVRVPVEEARALSLEKVNALRAQTGGVTKSHIDLLSETDCKVGAYEVDLRGSLQRNLKMRMVGQEQGILLGNTRDEAKKALGEIAKTIDPNQEKVVLFHRPEEPFPLPKLVALFQEFGIEVLDHAIEDDRPLMFGMSNQFRN